jgi:hypothetical protein
VRRRARVGSAAGRPEGQPSLVDLVALGAASAIAIGGGTALGSFLDGRLRTGPALTFAGLAIGVAVAIGVTVRQARRLL